MKAHAISLETSARRVAARERGSAAGLDIDFFDAVDAGSSEAVGRILAQSAGPFRARYGRAQTRGELACLLSHNALCASVLGTDEAYVLVLEDDFIPLVSAACLRAIAGAGLARGADVLILGYAKVDDEMEQAIDVTNPLMDAVPVPGTNRVLGQRCHETTCGALSYVVSPRFVRAMATNVEYGRLADDWDYHKRLGMNVMHASPLCFREDFAGMTSSLETARAANGRRRIGRLPAFLRPSWRHALGMARRVQFFAGKIAKGSPR